MAKAKRMSNKKEDTTTVVNVEDKVVSMTETDTADNTKKEIIVDGVVVAETETKDLNDKPVETPEENTAEVIKTAENKSGKVQFTKELAVEYFTKVADFFADKLEKKESLTPEEETVQTMVKYSIDKAAKSPLSELLDTYKTAKEFFKSKKEATANASEKPKAPSKPGKPSGDKKTPDAKKSEVKSEVKTIEGTTTNGADKYPIAVMFPKTLKHPDGFTLKAAYDKYTTWEEVVEFLSGDSTLYFVCFWTKRQLKDFDYNGTKLVKAPKEGFPNDLDIVQAAIPCESIKRLWGMSIYTEGLYRFEEDDFDYVEDTDPRNKEAKPFRVRMSAGMEFEIYERAEDNA